MKHLIGAIATVLILGGCTLAPLFGLQQELDFVEGKGITALARSIDVYCSTELLNMAQREKRLRKLNEMTIRGDMMALDCNLDGKADFVLLPE